jgi:hypothetical protein
MAGCGGRANPLPGGSTYASSAVAPTLAAFGPADETSILKLDKKQVAIGSTIDPKYHQLNPYGLAVAPKNSGPLAKGDLVVCNFNDKQNVQGTGFTIVALHPSPGSKARLIVADKKLTHFPPRATSTRARRARSSASSPAERPTPIRRSISTTTTIAICKCSKGSPRRPRTAPAPNKVFGS